MNRQTEKGLANHDLNDQDKVPDWLRVLDLEPGVSFEDVRRAHRDMAKVWHPDRFPNDERLRAKAEEHQKKINEAFANLERWFKSGQALPALATPDMPMAPPPYAPAGQPPVHKRHPQRDTWTIRTPLGVRQGYKGVRRKRTPFWRRRWKMLAAVFFGVVTVLLVVATL